MHVGKKSTLRPALPRQISPKKAWPSEQQASGPILRAAPERWHHGAEPTEAPVADNDCRRGQRVDSGIAQLAKTGKIGLLEVSAAARWRDDYELGECGARDPDKSGNGGGVEAALNAIIDSLTRYRYARHATGEFGDTLLRLFVAEGMSLRAIAPLVKKPERDMTGLVVGTLILLAEHYERIDKNKAPPPWERSRMRDDGRQTEYGSLWQAEISSMETGMPIATRSFRGRA